MQRQRGGEMMAAQSRVLLLRGVVGGGKPEAAGVWRFLVHWSWSRIGGGDVPGVLDVAVLRSADVRAGRRGGAIQRTCNGRATWTAQAGGLAGAFNYPNGVAFPDASNGWAVGYGGTIVHTSNGGTTWS